MTKEKKMSTYYSFSHDKELEKKIRNSIYLYIDY